jgi:hypothetical protein
MADVLSADVEAFLLEKIASIEQLEQLLQLQREPHRWCTAAELAAALKTVEASAERCLDGLETRGLVVSSDARPRAFRYAPPTELRPVIDAIAAAYPRYRVRVIGLVYSDRSRPDVDGVSSET